MSDLEPDNRAVAVYCASSVGKHPAYVRAAQSLGKALAETKRRLIYGGGSKGIMGAVSGAVVDAGGEVTGLYHTGKRGPSVLLKESGRERSVVVNTMHERKTEMAKRSGSFIALPGGYGLSKRFHHPTNANLVRFVNGPADHAEHEDFDWGKAALDVLEKWTFPERTHFYDWSKMKSVDGERIGDALDAV
ncbi:uncharacterized protein B0H18DRAFT_979270 [Fomitopsis serialis]|uniref:uncharacterized protein n=1 Tax=Fomitopsis serialis TaxID=139415 RepID=UPI0020080F32|nr:uncharacterized protein B0H18DRAFT_979270 [Neoantrodia serialis]KAH9934979.1 hypothetical protein B0H18DRAFT_979270 [Neoantrodia serialis]